MPDNQQQDSTTRFWLWFTKTASAITDAFHTNDMPKLTALSVEANHEIKKISPGLICEFARNNDTGNLDITISANADVRYLDAVTTVCHKAPNIQGWSVIAFRQRKPRFGQDDTWTTPIAPDTIWYKSRIIGNGVELTLYIKEITDANRRPMLAAVHVVLCALVGEYTLATKVRRIDWRPLTQESHEMKKLIDLPTELDSLEVRH